MTTPNDLLIIGAGNLGRRIAKLWRERYASSEIVCETRTDASHDALKLRNVTPNLAGTATRSFPKVVFCVSPGYFADYREAVTEATRRVSPGGRFVFTSSTSVYGDAKWADERTATTSNPRGKKIADAESGALAIDGGAVIRLPGMYAADDGVELFNFSRREMLLREESTWNMIHYDDAAEAVVRLLSRDELRERIFLASVATEVGLGEYVDHVLRHPKYKGNTRPMFLADGPVVGRKHENAMTRSVLGWKPRYESIGEFVDSELI